MTFFDIDNMGGGLMDNNSDYRKYELQYYMISNIVIILYFGGIYNVSNEIDMLSWIKVLIVILQSSVFSCFVGVLLLLIGSLLSWTNKLEIVYLFRCLPPGASVFSDIKSELKDFRFTKNDALEKYQNIYDNMPSTDQDKRDYENANWYKLFVKHSDNLMIIRENREYMMFVDIFIDTILLLLIYLFSCIFGLMYFSGLIIALFTLELILSNVATREKGKRLVTSVIAIDMSLDETIRNT